MRPSSATGSTAAPSALAALAASALASAALFCGAAYAQAPAGAELGPPPAAPAPAPDPAPARDQGPVQAPPPAVPAPAPAVAVPAPSTPPAPAGPASPGASPAQGPGGPAAPSGAPPEILWAKAYGGAGEDAFTHVSATSDGGLVAAGRSASADGDSDGNRGASDAWIVRLDSDGGVVWKRTFGGSDVDYASSVAETADGGFFAAGATRSGDGDFREASGDLSAWAARLDPDGGLLWLKVFGGDVGWEAKAVLEVHDGGFLVMGEVDSPEDGCPDGGPCGNLMVVRLDPDGGTLRVRRPRARATLPGNAAVGIPGGEAAMAYEMYSRDGSPEARVTRAGREGRHLWTRTVASDAASYALATVGKGGSGGFVGAGEASRAPEPGGAAGRRPWIFRLNPDGALLWEALPLGGASGEFRGVAVADGGFFAVGAAENLAGDGAGHYDILAAFADSGGAALWTLALGGSGMDWASSAAAPPGGALYIGGTTNSSDGDFAWRARAGDRPDADGLVVKLARPAAAHGDE